MSTRTLLPSVNSLSVTQLNQSSLISVRMLHLSLSHLEPFMLQCDTILEHIVLVGSLLYCTVHLTDCGFIYYYVCAWALF